MKYAFILSWLTVEEWLDGLVWNTVLSHFTYLIEMSQEVDKSNVLLETKSRKQIVNNLFWCLYFSLLLKRKSSHYLCYLLHACACARSVVSNSLRPHGLYPPGSSVHGILQARISGSVLISPFWKDSFAIYKFHVESFSFGILHHSTDFQSSRFWLILLRIPYS